MEKKKHKKNNNNGKKQVRSSTHINVPRPFYSVTLVNRVNIKL